MRTEHSDARCKKICSEQMGNITRVQAPGCRHESSTDRYRPFERTCRPRPSECLQGFRGRGIAAAAVVGNRALGGIRCARFASLRGRDLGARRRRGRLPGGARSLRPGATCAGTSRVHRSTTKLPLDVRRVDGLPLTAPERTILDLASVLRGEDLEVALESARRRRLVTLRSVETRLDLTAGSGWPGLAELREIVQGAAGQPATDSRLEVRVSRLLRAARLPPPERQHPVVTAGRRFRLDFAWPPMMVALECDGRGRHANREAFTRDRARWTALAAAGWRVLIATWRDVTDGRDHFLGEVARALAS